MLAYKNINSLQKALFSRSFSSRLPIGEPTDFVPKGQTIQPYAPISKVTELKNGIRVATINTNVSPGVAIGMLIKSGTRNETPENFGASVYLKRMAFQSTNTRTSLRLTREFEHLGATYRVSAGREHLMFSSEATADKLPEIVPLFSDVASPALLDWEVRDQIPLIEEETHDLERDARAVVFELLHQEAYRNRGLGNSLIPPAYNLHNINADTLQQFVLDNYTSDKITLVATGNVDHEAFVKIAQDRFGAMKASKSGKEEKPSQYFGGDVRVAADGDAYVALAFEGAGLGNKDAASFGTLQALLGGAAPVSDVIGNGASSKIHRAIAGEDGQWLKEVSAFNVNYSDSGLFGLFAIAEKGNNARLLSGLGKAVQSVVGSLDDNALNAAKKRFKADLYFNNETRSSLLQYAAYQAMVNGKIDTIDSLANSVDGITVADIKRVAAKAFSGKTTLVAVGDVQDLPDSEAIKKSFKLD